MRQGPSVSTARLNPEVLTEITSLAAHIKAARTRRRISRAEMSARTRVSPDTIARLEKGDSTVSLGTVLQILSALGLARGISEVVAPENDVAQTVREIRDRRLGKRAAREQIFSKEELDF